jgi:Zn-dependent protease
MFNLDPITIITRLLTLLIAFPAHEFAHAKTADAFGDPTPGMYGRVSLNPLVHLDVFGALIFMAVGFGWAKPVPVNPFMLGKRSTAAYMLVALAGPMTNLILALLVAIPLRLGLFDNLSMDPHGYVAIIVSQFIFYNLILAFFNLIPLAPLDGEKIADFFFPPSWAKVLDTIRPYGPIILMGVLFILPMIGIDILGTVLFPPIERIYHLLVG